MLILEQKTVWVYLSGREYQLKVLHFKFLELSPYLGASGALIFYEFTNFMEVLH